MFRNPRFIIKDDYPCALCDGVGSVYKTVEFDENGESQLLLYDFQCIYCGKNYEVTKVDDDFVPIPFINLEN